ncbi:hypothetical protein EOM86_06210 [Candidatus Nomurabacteria bacterium]|nr:hypothetical protein [Candidatus Nomurabacteria bacterium]
MLNQSEMLMKTGRLIMICLMAVSSLMKSCSDKPSYPKMLMEERFSHPQPYGPPCPLILSGWETDLAGGDIKYDYFRSLTMTDTSESSPVSISKSFIKQTSGVITVEFRFKPDRYQDFEFQLLGSDKKLFCIGITAAGELYYHSGNGDKNIFEIYKPEKEYGILIQADADDRSSMFYVNGTPCSEPVKWDDRICLIDSVSFRTGSASTGELMLFGCRIHTGYEINDTFISYTDISSPAYWDISGGAITVETTHNSVYPDILSMKIRNRKDTEAKAVRKTSKGYQKFTVEAAFMIPERFPGYALCLENDDASGVRIETTETHLCVRDVSGSITEIVPYRENIWYHMMFEVDTDLQSCVLTVNGKKSEIKIPFITMVESLDRIAIVTPSENQAIIWIDDVKWYEPVPLARDYVPEPVPAKHPGTLIGVQSCPLWREGSHGGWDFISPFGKDRKPLLGWYEDGNPEVSDWEIKWLSENGVDFMFYTWFLPPGRTEGPIKSSALDDSLHHGFFRAKYKEYMKFAITWENNPSHSCIGSSDFRNNIVPYWFEYYFNDPQYLIIDNKPLVGILSYEGLIRDFGSKEAVKEEMDHLQNAFVEAGFDGANIITWYHGTDPKEMKDRYDAGLDATYAYTFWSDEPDKIHDYLEKQRDSGTGLNVVPVMSMGWDHQPWGGKPLGWMSSEDYSSHAVWIKDVFMPSLPEGSIGRKLLLLDNWNEFGEGHFIMPTEGLGFRYLDVIRKTWIGETIRNAVPSDRQKKRINNLHLKD